MKGYHAVVKDVIRGQPTLSGLCVIVQLTHADPANPFKIIKLDYDDVVEAKY
jgi:hypothetical protein